MERDVRSFDEIDRTQVALVGGKGAQLAELARIEGIHVPRGICVTTDAFRRVVACAPSVRAPLDRLTELRADDHEATRTRSAEIRRAIEAIGLPDDLAEAIASRLARLGESRAYAVRSSATAEDLPTASFAGQQDTYLDVRGTTSILDHVRRCWASLFTERAVAYRLRNGFDHREVFMAVVIQEMVFAEVAGVLFTADPVTSHRKTTYVEATFGLGEALVSGHVNADVYRVRNEEVVARPSGPKPTLTDAQVVHLARLGRRIEARFGSPQDIEWCLAEGDFAVVQSRPITTLFPVPANDDGENHVYVSVGHQQMMTDPMKPLGWSLFQLTAGRPMYEAGGRLFVDVARGLGSPTSRAALLDALGQSDPLIGDALRTILERGDFVRSLPDPAPDGGLRTRATAPLGADPGLVAELVTRTESSIAALKREIASKSGPPLLEFILADIDELKRLLFDAPNYQAILASVDAARWLNEQLDAWLGEKNAADALTQSVPHNVTSAMGLALLDVADAVRPYPEVVAFLRGVDGNDGFLDELTPLAGGPEARSAIVSYLETYGMRCVGEIDVTRPRWSEAPSALVPMILGNVTTFERGARARRFEQGLETAAKKEREVIERLRALPDGDRKAEETKRQIDRVRTFAGYREYPKYGIVCRYFVRGAGADRPRRRQGQPRGERHPRHDLHGPELDAALRRDQRARDGGGRPHDPRRGDRAGVWATGRRWSGERDPEDS